MFDLSHIVLHKKLLIIDIDDTILSYKNCHQTALNSVLTKFAYSIDQYEEARNQVKTLVKGANKHNKELYFKKMAENSNRSYSEVLDISNEYNYLFYKNLKLDLSIKNLLNYCIQNGIKICALSNFHSLEQIKKLKHLSILNCFSFILTSEDTDLEKPHPMLISHILNKFGVLSCDTVIIGDSICDKSDFIDFYPYNCNNLFFSICGKSGCGKSTLSLILKEIFGSTIIEGDSYHKYERSSDMWNLLTHYNFEANHLEKMNNDVRNLFYQQNIFIPHYDHSTGKFSNNRKINAQSALIFEGLHFLNSTETNKFFKFKIFIDSENADNNKIKRDTTYRNKTKEEVCSSIERRESDYQKFIFPQKEKANMIFEYSNSILTVSFNHEFNFEILSSMFEKMNKPYTIKENQFMVSYEISNTIREFRPIVMKIFNSLKRNFYE